MNGRFLITILAVFVLSITACDNDDLVALNVDQNSPTEMDPSFLLARSQLQFGASNGQQIRSNLIYASSMIQQNADVSAFPQGDKYFFNNGYSSSLWGHLYGQSIKELTFVVDNVDPTTNLYAIALANRTYALHVLTDMYGDLPYEQAGRGLGGQENWFPAYDAQQDVYGFIVRDLREARNVLSAGGDDIGAQDVIYQGDVAAWGKFINSILLRAGMRMSNIDPVTAQQVVEDAVANGVFESNDDEAFIDHIEGQGLNTNGTSHALRQGETYANELRPSRVFIDWMQDNNDPRLMIITGGTGDPFDPSTWNTDPAAQIGLPNGFDDNTILDDAIDQGLITDPNDYSLNLYSFINPQLFDMDDPHYLIRYAEVEFMLAEAALNGWNVGGGSAQDHFEAGIRATFGSWARYGVPETAAADIDAYIAGLNFAGASTDDQYRMIGEQYWAATYMTSEESWANWRRTGFPVLTAIDYPGNVTQGTIPRRWRYPENEGIINGDNYRAVIARQGPDLFNTSVWWDAN